MERKVLEAYIIKNKRFINYYCKQLYYDTEKAKDLSQDVVLHLLTKKNIDFDESKDFVAWVRVVIKNLYYEQMYSINQKNRRKVNNLPKIDLNSPEFYSFEESRLTINNEGLDNLLYEEVEKLMSNFPNKVTEIFKMRAEGYSLKEIADKLKTTSTSISSTITFYRGKIKNPQSHIRIPVDERINTRKSLATRNPNSRFKYSNKERDRKNKVAKIRYYLNKATTDKEIKKYKELLKQLKRN